MSVDAKFLKDGEGQIWNTDELQALALFLGNFTSVASRLGLKRHDVTKALKDLGVFGPPDFLRKKAEADPVAFRDLVIDMGMDGAAKYFNVSEAHVKNILKDLRAKQPQRR